ncbi:HpaII family restriction endonuclease, partial [Bacteroides ovatus]
MAFEATKKEWCELYSFFRLLADGKVVLGTAEAKTGDTFWPVAMIQREEHDGTRQYYIEEDTIRIEGENGSKSMPREDFGIVADLILQAVKSSSENDVVSPEGVEE